MYCPRCSKDIFGGSICHLCGGVLAESEGAAQTSPSRKPLKIFTRKKYRVAKEFGQTLPGHVARLFIEIAIFCIAFIALSILVIHVANWLSTEMTLEGQRVKLIELQDPWMKYFWFIGCTVIIFLTIKLRFRPGK